MTEGDLALLACGAFEENTEIGEVLDNIAGTITVIQNRIIDLPQADDDTVTMLGPFFARTLLENVMTALIGRLDPFRLLFTKKVQQHESYELGRPSNAAIRWSGDVIDKKKVPDNLWKSDKEFQQIERGLLGGYYGEVFWRPAFEVLLDFPVGELDFLADYRDVASEDFINRMRSEALYLYSGLSKGVHGEFVIKPEIIYDRRSVSELIRRTLKLCAIVSLVSHGIDSAICRLELQGATDLFTRIKARSDQYDE